MESNGLPSGMFSNMGSGMPGLEMSLHHQQHQQNPQTPRQLQQPQHQTMVAFGNSECDHHPQTQQSSKQQGYPFPTKHKIPQLTFNSDEDEPGPANEDSGGDGKRKMSPWQRMKWTDSMVRLLIMVVFYIGDEVGSEGNDPAAKKKGGGVLQKKGKWKSVSRAMLERGFYVSPQQCEDKFNDLNKRYKRVNDILGKGTACRVVENQSLLDSMDHLSPKMKEEVKKLLTSKHLFFREMCAYHNSCGGGTGAQHSPEPSQIQAQAQAQAQPLPQQRCLHSSGNPPIMVISDRAETEGSKDDDYEEGNNNNIEDEDEEEEEEDDEEVVEGGVRGYHDDEEDTDERCFKKRTKKRVHTTASPLIQKFSSELASVVQDMTKSAWEKRHWMKTRLMQLEEQRVGYQSQALELEKQRLKWVKFSSKKEREMEVEKLTNERMRLENDRMVLLLRQQELDSIEIQQPPPYSSIKRSDPSSITG